MVSNGCYNSSDNVSICSNISFNVNNINNTANPSNITFFVIQFVVSFIGLFANIFNIAAILHIPQGQTTHSKLIISLGVADICLSILGLILVPIPFLKDEVQRCFIVVVDRTFSPFAVVVLLLNLLALGIDQYVAIVKPLHYQRLLSTVRINVLIHLLWIISVTIGLLDMVVTIFVDVINGSLLSKHFTFCEYILNAGFRCSEYIIQIVFILVSFALIFLYVRTFLEYRQFVARREVSGQDELHDKKAIITTLLVIGTFQICWFPIGLLSVLNELALVDYNRTFLSIGWMLMMLNVLCDPIIYGVRLLIVRHGYKILFRRVFRKPVPTNGFSSPI